MANLDRVPLYYLRLVGDLFALNEPEKVKEIINAEIEKREKPNYDGVTLKEMCEWGIITLSQGAFLFDNKIYTFKDFMECNLDDLVGITPELKKVFDRKRWLYDLSRYDLDKEENIDGHLKK